VRKENMTIKMCAAALDNISKDEKDELGYKSQGEKRRDGGEGGEGKRTVGEAGQSEAD
jgi:hypothetical protein